MNKIFLLRSRDCEWGSCRTITDTLEKIYRSWKDASVETIYFEGDLRSSLFPLFKASANESIHLILIDYFIPYPELGRLLFFASPKKIKITLHLFGDCINRKKEISDFNQMTSEFQKNFFLSSQHFLSEMKKTLPPEICSVIPYPVRDIFFATKLKSNSVENVIRYVGRINTDKGSLPLLRWWKVRRKKANEKLELIGPYSPDQKYSRYKKAKFAKLTQELLSLLSKPSKSSALISFKDPRALARKLASPGVMITLSTFELEDFGLAIAEGMASGSPAIISKWKGHKEFQDGPYVHLLPVKTSSDPVVDLRELESVWKKFSSLTLNERREQREWARKKFSESAVSELIRLATYSDRVP